MSLFEGEEFEVPLFRERAHASKRPRGAWADGRFEHDYPPEWHRCPKCDGRGKISGPMVGYVGELPEYPPQYPLKCDECLGMGSVKAMTRLLAGHRCERCAHPYVPKGDAKMLGVEPTVSAGGGHMGGRWTPCDEGCTHGGPVRYRRSDGNVDDSDWAEEDVPGPLDLPANYEIEAEWRILTVHHLDGDKANLRWWNLAALCQRCHLEIQAKVVLERVWPHEHSKWFKPHAAGWYAFGYLGEELTRDEVDERQDELLALERA